MFAVTSIGFRLFRLRAPERRREAVDYTKASNQRDADVPLDLSRWIPRAILVSWIQEETVQLGLGPTPVRGPLPARELEPECMFGILLLAWCTGVFALEDMVCACREDSAYWGLCHCRIPFTGELETFRRRHRDILRQALGRIACRALKMRWMQEYGIPPTPELERGCVGTVADRIDITGHMDTWSD
jgi:hypothetical protein